MIAQEEQSNQLDRAVAAAARLAADAKTAALRRIETPTGDAGRATIVALQAPGGGWVASHRHTSWSAPSLESLVTEVRRVYPEAIVRATQASRHEELPLAVSEALVDEVTARLHFVNWPGGADQPSWLVTEGVASGDAVDTIICGLAQHPGRGPDVEDLECEELTCTFAGGGQLRVSWPDGRIEDLRPDDEIYGDDAGEAIRSWAAHSWRTDDERQAAASFLATVTS